MNFVSELPLTCIKKNLIWVIVDRLTKLAHFLPIHTDYSLQKLAKLYILEILRSRSSFCISFWEKLHETLGTRLDFSTTFHLQNDGQSERVIQILKDMLRGCIIEFQAKFAYNNSFQSSIQITYYEALSNTIFERKIRLIQERLIATLDRKKSYVDLQRKDIKYNVGD
ncbi:Retrotransposon protein, Ty3-gypsy subclass [Gossypium australe]|uniref:Retrotransposon protein, Ty3-gypsy subclass n=1 Tax=Gossypium australe TaxID=47621 RepID=A0A5B6WDI9_9ROSI|nr:Retrotransposon protein, Ty3-gypsy subclass [Gossypium australe]